MPNCWASPLFIFLEKINYSSDPKKAFIQIGLNDDYIEFPLFYKNKMYINMESDRKYTLEEIGL